MRIGIVGAGMAGLACADSLSAIGHQVVLFDKARGPGGRMSTRRMDTPLGQAAFDHGAQYFTVRHPGFREQVARWAAQGVAMPWRLAGEDAWVGTPAMNSVIKAMAANHEVHWSVQVALIEKRANGWALGAGEACHDGFDVVVLALPAEQAAPFLMLHDFDMARHAMLAHSQPCWTGMYAFDTPLPVARDMLRDAGMIGWAARNSAKPGRSGPESWVVQARVQWSTDHLEDAPGDVAAILLDGLAAALGQELPVPAIATAHRWRYAMSAGLGLGALWNPGLGLGVCGDWLLGPRVECAWLSGQDLARRMAEAPV